MERDIKPLNILLNSAIHAKVAVFGLAAMGIFEPTKITGCLGTTYYMAPELLDKNQKRRRKILSDIRELLFFEEIKWENGEAPPLSSSGRNLKTPSCKRLNVADMLFSEDEDFPISLEEQQFLCNFSFLSERLKMEIISPPSKPPTSDESYTMDQRMFSLLLLHTHYHHHHYYYVHTNYHTYSLS